MAKLGVLSKLIRRVPSPFGSREASVGTPQQSRPATPLSTSSRGTGVSIRPHMGGLVTELPLARGDRDASDRPPTTNVILFGEAGVGKSAVVNLIAQRDVARVSADVKGCTMQSTRYDISLGSDVAADFCIFDTVGLNQPELVLNSHLEAIERAYELIRGLRDAGGIHLLLFCMRRGKITMTTRNNYRLFVEFLCQKKVPVAVVVTGCEHEEEMDHWWTRNETEIERLGIKSNGHACVTAVTDGTPGEDLKYEESQRKICELLRSCSLKSGAFTLDAMAWLAMIGKETRNLIKEGRTPKRRDIEKVLSGRLRIGRDNVKRIVDMMERGDTSPTREER